ncbi:MAG: sel1 repeat family protein [Mesorhizobium sp.]|uniref:tetratricopeptide repeat protein n=1 Tax=Mesorhizobium sp. TaxID=1871066 RepID=UPI001ACA024B|nr:hypothetical protein [Mesorhizobium sp.]MBN9216903.1 sel1 repeat family protein [Mesorhizobium sp.]
MERARAGDAEAQCDLGRFYFEQADDADAAIHWFSAAAKQGLPRANHNLGVMAANVDRLEIAKACFAKAALAGWANSNQALGVIFRQEGDLDRAAVCFAKAIEGGNAQALADLASIVMDGTTDDRYSEALRLARAAAQKGVAGAYTTLFLIYNEGLGVPQDQLAAVGFARQGAELGDASSQAIYGVFLHAGKFVTRDLDEAAFMLSMAAQQGNYAAQAYYRRALDSLNDEQLARLDERLKGAGYRHMAPLGGNRFWRVWIKRPLSKFYFHFLIRTGQSGKLDKLIAEGLRQK